MFPFGCCSLFTWEVVSFCSSMSCYLLTLSCRCIGALLARCFLKIASGFRGKLSDEFTFPTSNLYVA